MADFSWTSEQQKVIDLRKRNILVSAAAGSGKTAVLVERIIAKITDQENPVDIDKILVVTFTKAAAAEMRGRISKAIEDKRLDNPEDENLQRQAILVHNAQITTIDSFCLFVVRNHFEDIELDPNFRIADTGEVKLLEMDVLDQVFAANYERADNESFINVIDAYSDKRSDSAVREMVAKIYRASSSDSWPRTWIAGLGELYRCDSVESLMESDFIKGITETILFELEARIKLLEEGLHLALEPGGPEPYAKTITQDLENLSKKENVKDFEGLKAFFDNIKFPTLAQCRGNYDEQRKNRVKGIRDSVKKDVLEIKDRYFSKGPAELVEQFRNIRPVSDELIRLALEYFDAMQAAKREKRILDFADVEHFALRILVDENTRERRAAAEEFCNQFEEIMIDEYQDSNQVQEDIMCAISREHMGTNNMFMVGDVKQSIYRFRLARPELFMSKYNTYTHSDSDNQRIDLYDNFRSRQEVVDFVNDVFYKIMSRDIGNVTYDEEAALHQKATFPEGKGFEPELLFCDKKSEDISDVLSEEDNVKALEALMVARKINDLMEKQLVTDKNTKELRPIKYSDIVILLRTNSWGEIFSQVLMDCNIPCYVESSSGYFSAYEVQVVLAMLRLLDNPYQDIPMATVLKSPIVGLDDEELAEISVREGNMPFSYKAIEAMREGDNDALSSFYEIYSQIREKLSDTPVHTVIQELLDKTGFGYYSAAMPGGIRRNQNLNMLIEKAIAYEKTSYKGLYHFVRYIDQLQKYEVDYGEADSAGDEDDFVRIMTIHKSKGLEFPVVFVSGLSKRFNEGERREKLVIHPDMGLGIDEMGTEPRTKSTCIVKSEVIRRICDDDLGEELRVLYVALTRAKEKLILSGVVNDGEKVLSKATGELTPGLPIAYSTRSSAKSYMDLIIPALISYPDKYTIEFVAGEDFAKREAVELARLDLEQAELLERINQASDYGIQELTSNFSFEYKYAKDADKKRKYSVSELKHISMAEKYDELEGLAERPAFSKDEREAFIPQFAQQDTKLAKDGVSPGALRGTAVHRVMECMPFAEILELDNRDKNQVSEYVKKQLEHQLKHDMITKEMYDMIIPSQMESFVASEVAMRMAKADAQGLLFREKPFVMKSDEGYLIQGIIDVFWFEGDDVVLLDYKTDSVKAADELVLRYKTQLDLYGDALSRIYTSQDKKVNAKECLIYSFRLNEVINL